MKKEADVVKELREFEKSGKLSSVARSTDKETFQKFEPIDDSLNGDLEKEETFGHLDETYSFSNEYGELYEKLVENSLEGILIIDFKGKILFANPAIAKIFGFKHAKETVGKSAFDFADPKYHKRAIKDQISVRMGNGGVLNTYKAVTASGKEIWVEVIGCKIKHSGKTANVVFIRDVTTRQKTWSELTKLGNKYKALAEMSSDAVLTIDPLGRLTYVNHSFEKMCEIKQDQIVGTPFRDYLSDESIYLFQQIFIDVRKNNQIIENVKLELAHGRKGITPIEVSLAPLKNSNNKFTEMVCTVHDITEHDRMEEELKKSERLKTEFMNIAAHELKSPIIPIKGYLELITSDEDTNEKTKKWGKISLRNTERLLKLVNDILDVSRFDSDTMTFNMEKLNLVEILDEITEDMKPAIGDKKLAFITHIPKRLPYILGDRYRLEQVLKNLVTNAIKFTDQGSISIMAKEEEKQILISVEDTGIGIANAELKKIFTKFYQAYTSNDRKSEGTGLGLFICKEIITKHNGKIWAESKSGKGSKFVMEIPHI